MLLKTTLALAATMLFGVVTPLAVAALPSSTAWAPAMSSTKDAAGDCIFGFSARLIANAKLRDVTGVPLLKRKPCLILKV